VLRTFWRITVDPCFCLPDFCNRAVTLSEAKKPCISSGEQTPSDLCSAAMTLANEAPVLRMRQFRAMLENNMLQTLQHFALIRLSVEG
jgi:hypothetical protein